MNVIWLYCSHSLWDLTANLSGNEVWHLANFNISIVMPFMHSKPSIGLAGSADDVTGFCWYRRQNQVSSFAYWKCCLYIIETLTISWDWLLVLLCGHFIFIENQRYSPPNEENVDFNCIEPDPLFSDSIFHSFIILIIYKFCQFLYLMENASATHLFHCMRCSFRPLQPHVPATTTTATTSKSFIKACNNEAGTCLNFSTCCCCLCMLYSVCLYTYSIMHVKDIISKQQQQSEKPVAANRFVVDCKCFVVCVCVCVQLYLSAAIRANVKTYDILILYRKKAAKWVKSKWE